MDKIYDISREGKWVILERQVYPRVKLFLDCSSPVPEISKINVLEHCSSRDVVQVICEIKLIIKEFSLQWSN